MAETLTGFLPAGGQGSRLRPHTDNMPKPLLLMGAADRRLIDIPLTIMEGCDTTFVSTHYKADLLEDKLCGYSDVTLLHEGQPLGNAGAFVEHYDLFSGLDKEGDTVIIPSDPVIEGLSLSDFHTAHRERGADVTAAVIPPKEYGLYVCARDGIAQGYTKQDDPFAMSTIGIYMIRNSYLMDWAHGIRRHGEAKPVNITYDLVEPHILDGRAAMFRLPEGSYWDDAGTHDRYHANNMMLSGGENVIDANAYVDPGAHVNRCVVLGSVVLGPGLELADAIVSRQRDSIKITQIHTQVHSS